MMRLCVVFSVLAVGLLAGEGVLDADAETDKTHRYVSDGPASPAAAVQIRRLPDVGNNPRRGHEPVNNFDVFELGLEIYAPVSDVVDNELCRNHSRQFLDAVRNHEIWASRMLDASAKLPPSGLLDGNLVLLGNYDECLAVERVDAGLGDTFSGMHCLLALGAASFFTDTTLTDKWHSYPRLAEAFRQLDDAQATPMGLQEVVSRVGIMWSVCVPSSCEPRDLQLHMQRALRPALGNVSVVTTPLMCNSRADAAPALELIDWLAIVVLAIALGLAVASTVYDVVTTARERRPWLLLAFSVKSNGRALLSAQLPADAIPAVDGLRVFSILWVVLLHHYQYTLYGPIFNLRAMQTMAADMNLVSFTNGSLCVDSFLLFSGLLLSYNYMRAKERGTFSLVRFYLNRYIRLTPSYALMLLLSASLVSYAGEGPFARVNQALGREACARSSWKSLVYLNNYLDWERSCLPTGWYLGMDMQLYWLSPLILYPLWRFKKLGKLLLGLLVALGVCIAFAIPYVNRIPLSDFMGAVAGADGALQYYPTHARFTPWLLGIGLGAALHTSRGAAPGSLAPCTLALGWLANNVLMNGAILPFVFFFQPGYEYEPLAASLYTALRRPAWALGLAWLVYACARGHGGFMNKVLSSRVFQVMSRLSYSVFLTHWTVIAGQTIFRKTPQHFDNLTMLTQYLGICVISFYFGTILYLLIEAPASVIGKALLSKPTKNVQKHKQTPAA